MKLFYCILFIFLVSFATATIESSCSNKGKLKEKLGDKKILVVYVRPDGNKIIDVFLRRVTDTIQRDSVGDKSRLIRATIWGAPIVDSVRDNQGKPILDSLNHKPSFHIVGYDQVDSKRIITDISGRDYDSLMKRDTNYLK